MYRYIYYENSCFNNLSDIFQRICGEADMMAMDAHIDLDLT